ncbi:MAG TPA: hypothetical protein PLO44_01855 [Candidatus Paceibacterota bacterium]|nr:hypothetical protein [Candidatus Paceibacterota bacterium]
MLPENIIFIGVVLNLFFTILYVRSIFKNKTKPNPISWFVWTLAPAVGVFLQIKAGANLSVLGTFMAGFGPFLVLTISLIFKKEAFWKINLLDIVCCSFAIFSLILYIITHKLGISILFAVLADFLAYIPIMIKTYKFPETENTLIFLGGIINNILALLIIKNWEFAIYAFPVYLILANTFEIFLISRKCFRIKETKIS